MKFILIIPILFFFGFSFANAQVDLTPGEWDFVNDPDNQDIPWEGPPLPPGYPDDGILPPWEGPPLPPGYSPDGTPPPSTTPPPGSGTTGTGGGAGGGGGGAGGQTIADVLGIIISNILNPFVGVLIALALVVFFVGVIKYIRVAGEDDKSEAKRIMWWGIIALFVMVSVWGLVQVVINTFFPGGNIPPRPPLPRF